MVWLLCGYSISKKINSHSQMKEAKKPTVEEWLKKFFQQKQNDKRWTLKGSERMNNRKSINVSKCNRLYFHQVSKYIIQIKIKIITDTQSNDL